MRNPAINELYSNGLHQGVSGIEEGRTDLKTEKVFKNTLEYEWLPSSSFSLNTLLYHQHFQDYIFLNPQDEIRLTIRGAFPVFRYEQTNANIYGLDVSTQFTISNSLLGLWKYSYLRGNDVENDQPLVFMPSNGFFGSLTYQPRKPIKLFNRLVLEKSEIEVSSRLVLEQKNILPEQDFVQPPPTYHLLGLKFSTNIILPNYKMRCFVKADNMLNVRYRDYLNRQRYFADDMGLSIVMGANLKF
jgi:iron complex outermembrane receptor protein